MKILHYYKLFIFFILLCAILLLNFAYIHKKKTIEQILQRHTALTIDKYKSTYHYYMIISQAINKSIIQTPKTMEILKKIYHVSPKKLSSIRNELKQHLSRCYLNLSDINFKQLHFHLKDNKSFLRMHLPNKYGDDLTETRFGVNFVNTTLNSTNGFEEGKTIGAFRFIYPLIDDKNRHLGSVEISVDTNGMIKSMREEPQQKIHFLIKKEVIDKKLWKSEFIEHYKESIENSLYYKENSDISSQSDFTELSTIFTHNIRKEMQKNQEFSLYTDQHIITLIPVQNIEKKYVAYFIVYNENIEINNILKTYWIFNIVILLLLFIIFYFLFKDYNYRNLTIAKNKILSKKVLSEIRKNKEQSLRNYITLFNTIPQPAVVMDPRSAKFIDVNNAIVKKYGFTREEMLNMSIYDLDITETVNIKEFYANYKQKKVFNFETQHIKKNGELINVIVNIAPLLINKRLHYLLLATDITEIRKVQEDIKLHRDILQTIVYVLNELITHNDFNQGVENSLKKIVTTLNIDRVYIFENYLEENKEFCSQKFEYVKENISPEINNKILQNIPYDETGLKRWYDIFHSNGNIEGFVKNFQGKEKTVLESQDIKSILVMPVWDNKKLWGFIGFDDCTKERVWNKLEKDVLKALSNSFISAYKKDKFTEELQQQVSSQLDFLREKDEQIFQQAKLAQMGDMVSMIAHQWRQPLNTISAVGINLSLLSSMNLLTDEKIQEDTLFLQDQCQKMSSTIDTFINFIKPTQISTPFQLIHTVELVLEIMGSQLEHNNIKVTLNLLNKQSVIVGHEDLLEQVIINILSNARDAFSEHDNSNKYIIINIDVIQNTPVIYIEDNAGGIPKKIQNKIFNPYFTTKEQGSGTGIGLYMSMDIMRKKFNGTIQYTGTEKGSTFSLIFGGGGGKSITMIKEFKSFYRQ